MTKQEILEVLVRRAENADKQVCDDRYDEGYADALYDAVAMIKTLVEE